MRPAQRKPRKSQRGSGLIYVREEERVEEHASAFWMNGRLYMKCPVGEVSKRVETKQKTIMKLEEAAEKRREDGRKEKGYDGTPGASGVFASCAEH